MPPGPSEPASIPRPRKSSSAGMPSRLDAFWRPPEEQEHCRDQQPAVDAHLCAASAGKVSDDRFQAVVASRDDEPVTRFARSMPVILQELWRVVTSHRHHRGF